MSGLVVACAASPAPVAAVSTTTITEAPAPSPSSPSSLATGGASGGASGASGTHAVPADAPSCASAAEPVGSASALKKKIDALSWRGAGRSLAGSSISADVTFTRDVVLDAAAFPLGDCNNRVCGDTRVELTGAAGSCVGVKGQAATSPQRCKKVKLKKGDVVRIAKVSTFEASGGNAVEFPRLVLEQRCATPCPSGAYRCAATNECLAEADYCSACLGQGEAVCACYGIPKDRPEKWQCTFRDTDGATSVGHCTAGRCVP